MDEPQPSRPKRAKLTAESLASLRAGEILWDTEVTGLYVRRNADDTTTLMFKQRVKGRQVKTQIGKYGQPWTLANARKEALKLKAAGLQGVNENERRAEERIQGVNIDTLCDLYLAGHGPRLKPSTYQSYAENMRLHIRPRLGRRLVASLDTAEIRQFHDRYVTSKRTGNYLIAILSAMINWGIAHGHLSKGLLNPCKGIKKYKENAPENIPSDEQALKLGQVMHAARYNRTKNHLVSALWIILYTGARKSEVLQLKRTDIDRGRLVANLSDSKTGAKRILLTAEALAVIDEIPQRGEDPYLFPETVRKSGSKQINKIWRGLREKAGVPKLRIHDLRHTFGTIAIESGSQTKILSKQLGHSTTRMTKRYTHVADKHWRASVDTTGREIATMFGPAKLDLRLKPRLRKRPLTAVRRTGDET